MRFLKVAKSNKQFETVEASIDLLRNIVYRPLIIIKTYKILSGRILLQKLKWGNLYFLHFHRIDLLNDEDFKCQFS